MSIRKHYERIFKERGGISIPLEIECLLEVLEAKEQDAGDGESKPRGKK